MRRDEFKKILKPLIRECIKEVVFEKGILSEIISEVVQGVRPLHEQQSYQQERLEEEQEGQAEQQRLLEQRWEEEREKKRKLLNAAGLGNVNIFEGTEPLTEGGSPNEGASSASGPLTGISPNDPGVDISRIMALGSNRWGRIAKGK